MCSQALPAIGSTMNPRKLRLRPHWLLTCKHSRHPGQHMMPSVVPSYLSHSTACCAQGDTLALGALLPLAFWLAGNLCDNWQEPNSDQLCWGHAEHAYALWVFRPAPCPFDSLLPPIPQRFVCRGRLMHEAQAAMFSST